MVQFQSPEKLQLEQFFSPTRPSGTSWSSSRDVCLFDCLSVCLSDVPFSCNFLRGRTGAERASSMDWCDLDLNLDLE